MGANDSNSHGGGGIRLRPGDWIHPELRCRDQWLVAKVRQTDRKKPPLKPSDPTAIDSGLAFEEAVELAEDPARDPEVADRLHTDEPTLTGFMVGPDDPLGFIDWDNVRDPAIGDESIPSSVLDCIAQVHSYTERSPSGTGLKTLISIDDETEKLLSDHQHRGDLGLDQVGDLDDPPHIEIYQERHYTTITGNIVTDPRTKKEYNEISSATAEVHRLIKTHLSSSGTSKADRENRKTKGEESTDNQDSGLAAIGKRSAKRYRKKNNRQNQERIPGDWIETDCPTVEQIWATGCAVDGDFGPLWDGNDTGYETTSEADHALVSKLWYYADDPALVDKAFRQSQRYRPKWETDSYREATMESTEDNRRQPHQGKYLSPDD